jgi:hypothetical protein
MEERIAQFADIDTRRAMGFPPRRLQIARNQILLPEPGTEVFKFYPNRNVLIYLTRYSWDHLEMEVYSNIQYDNGSRDFVAVPGYCILMRTYRMSEYGMNFAGTPRWVYD